MSAFLFLLVKVNLAMGMAIILVALLRRPLRLSFGAPIAYAIWFLAPIAGLASLLPPRVVMLAPTPVIPVAVSAPASVMGHITHSTLRLTEQLTGQGAIVLAVPPPAPVHWMPDTALLLFAAWVLGTVLMTLHLARLQLRFHAAVRRGDAGPAVLGFIRPRIVTPEGFQDHFTGREQAAILAHERVHLARQDARINALVALLRCLCWFNPLVHLGARWLRIDQELACDATVVAGHVSRRDYALALLKSQLVVTSLPLGCNWPGAQHPLVERVALLKCKRPGTARRLAGASLVLLAASFAGVVAWAVQPPVAAKSMTARSPMMVLASRPAPDQMAQEPAASSSDIEAQRNARAHDAVFVAPAPRMVRIETRMEAANVLLPQMVLAPEAKIIADQPVSPVASAKPKDAAKPVVMANTPSGEGAPDTITCRAPQRIAGTNQFGEEACGHNYEWKKLALNGKDLAPDDRTLIPRATAPATADVTAAGAATDALLASASGHQTGTEPALACLLGFVPWQCVNRLWGGAVWPITNCAKQYIHRWLDNCYDGPLESVDYLGTNTAGADVYDVRYMHSEVIYIIAPPGPDGKLGWFKINRGNPNSVVPPSLVDVSSSGAGKTTLYRRPWR